MKLKLREGTLFFFLILLSACAKIVAPVGGPKDTTPPKIVTVSPPDQSTHFDSKTIKISFDEFVVLNNPNERVVFSPPLEETPEFSISRKSMIIKFKDSLQSNTTYNIAFPDCVKDFTEGNLLSFFNYTFSTGGYIDSFFVQGEITDALTLAPATDCFVFLYKENIDSLPYTAQPDYISKTNKEGKFRFMNIADGHYKIFALRDINHNFKYDLPNETIAFQEDLVEASPMCNMDSTYKDTLLGKKDNFYHLLLFEEVDTTYRKVKMITSKEGEAKFIFYQSVEELAIRTIDTTETICWFEVWNRQKDTLTLYLKEVVKDTIFFEFFIDKKRLDTFHLAPFHDPQIRIRGRGKSVENKMQIKIKNQDHLYEPLLLLFPTPLMPADSLSATLIKKKKSGNDTLRLKFSIPDTFITQLPFYFEKEEKVPYTLLFRESLFWSYQNQTHDTLLFNFSIKSEKDYGDLIIHYIIEENNKSFLVTLLSSNDKAVQEDTVIQSKTIYYNNLPPGQYKIKVIDDLNHNGKWDSGNYMEKRQPEPLFYFEKPISIRGYWEVEERFLLKSGR